MPAITDPRKWLMDSLKGMVQPGTNASGINPSQISRANIGGSMYGNQVTGLGANDITQPFTYGGFSRQQMSRRPTDQRVQQVGQMAAKQENAAQVGRNLNEYRSQQDEMLERLRKLAAGENLYSDRASDATARAMGQAAMSSAASTTGGRRAYGAASGQAAKLAGGARSLINNRSAREQEMDAARNAIAEVQREKVRFEQGLKDIKLSEQEQRLSERIAKTKQVLQMMDLYQSDIASEQAAQQGFAKSELLDQYDALNEYFAQQDQQRRYISAMLNTFGKGASMVNQLTPPQPNTAQGGSTWVRDPDAPDESGDYLIGRERGTQIAPGDYPSWNGNIWS